MLHSYILPFDKSELQQRLSQYAQERTLSAITTQGIVLYTLKKNILTLEYNPRLGEGTWGITRFYAIIKETEKGLRVLGLFGDRSPYFILLPFMLAIALGRDYAFALKGLLWGGLLCVSSLIAMNFIPLIAKKRIISFMGEKLAASKCSINGWFVR